MNLPDSIDRLIQEFSKLPSIGRRTAERIALHLLKKPQFELDRFTDSIKESKKHVKYCKICSMLTEQELCEVCASAKSDHGLICVVSEISDLISIERSGSYRGVYHVLHGELSPLDGIGPEHLSFEQLWGRLERGMVSELILATNPTFEGESTALYITKFVKERFSDIKITRLAQGLPQGGSVEYIDHITLEKAISGRIEV